MKKRKKFELQHIFSLFVKYKNADKVANELNISKSNLSYYTKKLKDLGVLHYLKNGNWEITGDLKTVQKQLPTHYNLVKQNNPKKEIKGHAYIWKVEFIRKFNWEELLKKNKIKYKLQSNGKVKRIFFEDRKIWLHGEGKLTIYEPFDYFGENAHVSKGLAVYNLDRLLKSLLRKLNQEKNGYKFTTRRSHYSLIKNELARQFNDKGEKLIIKTENGTPWMWIDNSDGLQEWEVGNLPEGECEETSKEVQLFWNDHKKTKFQVTPSFILKTMYGIQKNQLIFDKNMTSHLEVLNKLGNAVDELRKEIKKHK